MYDMTSVAIGWACQCGQCEHCQEAERFSHKWDRWDEAKKTPCRIYSRSSLTLPPARCTLAIGHTEPHDFGRKETS